MNTQTIVVAFTVGLAVVSSASADTPPAPTRESIEREMGLRSEGDVVRGQRDTVGFTAAE